jgi:hypothetical protein
MRTPDTWIAVGPFRGRVHPAFRTGAWLAFLGGFADRDRQAGAAVLHQGRNRVIRLAALAVPDAPQVVVKSFGRQAAWRDLLARWRGTKAARAFEAGRALAAEGIATPTVVACLELWHEGRLRASHLVTLHVPELSSLRNELNRLYTGKPECGPIMDLCRHAADAVRCLHEAGFRHRDLGNQNIHLGPGLTLADRQVYFLDLNRARHGRPLGPRGRARDLSRLDLPSDFRRAFLDMYWGDVPPKALLRWERFHRLLYAWHHRSRILRHPLRERRLRRDPPADGPARPPDREIWVWDERSGQPVSPLRSQDRRRYMPLRRPLQIAMASAVSLPSVWTAFRRAQKETFSTPVPLDHALSIAVDGRAETLAREVELLREMDAQDVLVRFYHHESPERRRQRVAAAKVLAEHGFRVAGALIQDRRAVRDPQAWRGFCMEILNQVGLQLEWVELGHAINRVKWGLWSLEEYRGLVSCLPALREAFPGLPIVGPGVIDSEFEFVAAALRRLPPDSAWNALSMHLYVDRRGAPENRHGPLDALGKFALARALARSSRRCADRLIVSEVNWPLLGTGVYSPVGAPYVAPGVRRNDPSVGEGDQANYLLRYLLLAACSGLVQQTVIWRLAAHGFGLVDDRPDEHWRRRPAFETLRVFRRLLGEGRFLRRLPTPGADPRRTFLLACAASDGTPLLVGWSHGAPVTVRAPFPVRSRQDAQGQRIEGPRDDLLLLSDRPTYAFGS